MMIVLMESTGEDVDHVVGERPRVVLEGDGGRGATIPKNDGGG